MLVLAMRTDKPEAEIGLYDSQHQVTYQTWQAHRELAETLHTRILNMLNDNHKTWDDLGGIVVYKGPGSFTGLRIGLSVANALAYSLQIPVVAANGETWQSHGCAKLTNGEHDTVALPEYGAPVHITTQRK